MNNLWPGTANIRAIARLDFRQRIRSRHLQIALAVVWLIALAAVIITSLPTGDHLPAETTYRYGIVGPTPSGLEAVTKPPARTHMVYESFADDAAAEAAVRSGHLTAALINGTAIVTRSDASAPGVVLFRAAIARTAIVERLEQAGVNPSEAERVAQPADPTIVSRAKPTRRGLSAAAVFAIALPVPVASITTYLMVFVSVSIQEERGTRMADMLLVPLRASELVVGKVLSGGMLAVVLVAIVGGSSAALTVGLHGTHVIVAAPLAAVAVAVFLLQATLYFFAAAAAGATVAGFIETQLVVLVFGCVGILCAMAGTLVAVFPTTPASTVASLLPPFSFPCMFARIATSHVPPWQPLLAALLAAAAITWAAKVASDVYLGAVAASDGDRISMRRAYQAGRAMRPGRATQR